MSTPGSPAQAAGNRPPSGRRKLLLVVVGLIVLAGVIGGGYVLWYVLLGPTGPAAVSTGAPAIPTGAAVAPPASFDGTWNVETGLGSIADGSASFVGYRVQEQLVGVGGHTAVGRTPKVTGSLALGGAVVSDVKITADMTALASDDSHRDDQLRRQAIESDNFPTATFTTTGSIDLGTLPADGTAVSVSATGTLTLHGVSKTVTVPLQVIRSGGIIAVTGTLPIIFSDYSIQKPNSFSVLSVDDHGTMELHLLFTHA
jgi:polyisoprenoid-binding protein YceI